MKNLSGLHTRSPSLSDAQVAEPTISDIFSRQLPVTTRCRDMPNVVSSRYIGTEGMVNFILFFIYYFFIFFYLIMNIFLVIVNYGAYEMVSKFASVVNHTTGGISN